MLYLEAIIHVYQRYSPVTGTETYQIGASTATLSPLQTTPTPSLCMGQTCWGPGVLKHLRYRQLNGPCLVRNVSMAYLPFVEG